MVVKHALASSRAYCEQCEDPNFLRFPVFVPLILPNAFQLPMSRGIKVGRYGCFRCLILYQQNPMQCSQIVRTWVMKGLGYACLFSSKIMEFLEGGFKNDSLDEFF